MDGQGIMVWVLIRKIIIQNNGYFRIATCRHKLLAADEFYALTTDSGVPNP